MATSMLGFCPKQRNASFVRINDQNGELIDTGIAIFFKSPMQVSLVKMF